MLSFKEVVGEIQRPDSEEAVVGAGNTESFRDADAVDRPVVQLEDTFEIPVSVVELQDAASLRRDEQPASKSQ